MNSTPLRRRRRRLALFLGRRRPSEEAFLRSKMTSTKKIAASRSNATKSTGPKTAQGKKQSRTNALRHGLPAIAPRDPATSSEIKRLATWLCGHAPTPDQYHPAHPLPH